MRVKKAFWYPLLIFFVSFTLGTAVTSYASLQENNRRESTVSESDRGKANEVDHPQSYIRSLDGHPDLLRWSIEVDDKPFQVTINRDKETITIEGEAEDRDQKDKVEHVIRLRAPNGFRIINEIKITRNFERERG